MNDFPRGKWSDLTLSLLRIVTGFLFLAHGAQKLFGWLQEVGPDAAARPPAQFPSMPWFAGVLEFFGGLCVMLGLFTRPVAFILAGEMAVAYFMVHFPNGFWPILNRGELAALYSFVFLFLSASGGGSFAVDRMFRRRTP